MINKVSLIIILLSSIYYSQNIKISDINKIEMKQYSSAFYPRFSKNDRLILFTSENYDGLYSYNVESKKTEIISNASGAGYNPLIIDDENIIFRKSKIENGKKIYSITSKNIKTNIEKILENDKRQISIPNQIVNSNIYFIENSSINIKPLSYNNFRKNNQNSKVIYSQNNNLFITENDNIINVSPMGKGVYVWESFSNDGEKILFTFGNQGSFLCDNNGNILLNIKDGHYPKFSPDGKYILYMKDKDDGEKYISSDLFVFSIDENKEYQITNTENIIEMFAEWSNDQTSIVYNTSLGEIYLAKISFEN
ncbi:MAG: PD40 domain-containing protein [Ignavibacteriae bacterium]|nr:PD40 domain-containing protein [Ignavibacteriota bacterium]